MSNQVANPITLGKVPPANIGPRAYALSLDFKTENTVSVSSALGNAFGDPQGVFVDNSNNPQSLVLTFPGPNQSLVIPAYSQAMAPILIFAGAATQFQVNAYSTGAVAVPVQVLNIAPPLLIWNKQTTNSGTTTVTGSVTTLPDQGAFTDHSGTITAGGDSQQVIPANGNRKALIISNPSSAAGQGIAVAESLGVNFTNAASLGAGSIELAPGGSLTMFSGSVSSEAVNVYAATTGHAFTAKEIPA